MTYYKIVGDRTVFSTCKTIQMPDGSWVSNPTAEQIEAAGWQVYVPPVIPPQPQNEPGYGQILQAVKRMLSTEAEELSDEDALDVAALFPTWASKLGSDVATGERLWDDGKLWKVLQPHTVQAHWRPADTPSLYAEVTIEEIPEWTPRTAENAFMKGDKCRHNGQVWESDIDYNTWEPGTVGTENLWHTI